MAVVAELGHVGQKVFHTGRSRLSELIHCGEFAVLSAGLIFESDPNDHFLHGYVKAAVRFMNPHIQKQEMWHGVNGEITRPLAHITGLDPSELMELWHESHERKVLAHSRKRIGNNQHPVVELATSQGALRGFVVISTVAGEHRRRRWYDKDGGICWKKVVGDAEQAASGLHDVALSPHENLDFMIKALGEGNKKHQEAYMENLQQSPRVVLPDFGLRMEILPRRP